VCLEISVWKSENHVFWSFCQFTLGRGILAPRCADLGSILFVYAQAWEAGAQAQRVQHHTDFMEKYVF
jgi:hypothetical protein